jgi:hypothetical protein
MAMTINKPVSSMGSWVALPISATFEQGPTIQVYTDHSVNELLTTSQIITLYEGTRIPNSGLVLKYPLLVEMETTRDGIVIRAGALDEDAFGLTYQMAYEEFLTSLRDRYYSLGRREASLSQQDLIVLQRLRDLLKPETPD